MEIYRPDTPLAETVFPGDKPKKDTAKSSNNSDYAKKKMLESANKLIKSSRDSEVSQAIKALKSSGYDKNNETVDRLTRKEKVIKTPIKK